MTEVFSPQAQAYLGAAATTVAGRAPLDTALRVRELVLAQEAWRRERCLNLTAAENAISRSARRLLDSDLANRLTEGVPGDKEYPKPPQNAFIDEIEAALIAMAKSLFHARHVEWRPVSNSMANAVAFFALTQPGDVILSQSIEGGGNYSYQAEAAPRIAGLTVKPIAHRGDHFEIDLDQLRAQARIERPRMIVIGGSYMLFPLPVCEIAAIAQEAGALLVYDAAHVSLLCATGAWPNPLDEGADILTLSTHKIMAGPVGGMVLTNDADLAARVATLTFPTFMQTRDLNKYAAAAHAFAEMTAHGGAYARQMIANARALAAALAQQAFNVLAAERGFTESHQVCMSLKALGPRPFAQRCRDANILFAAERLTGDPKGQPSGTRLSVQEITRQGLREAEMSTVAALIARAGRDQESPAAVAREVEALIGRFPRLAFSFDASLAPG